MSDNKCMTNAVHQHNNIEYINIAKGIGIFLVVIGHAFSAIDFSKNAPPEIANKVIYLIHMPLFFVVSGYLFEKNVSKYQAKGFKSFFVNKAKVYMIPYVTFSALALLLIFICAKVVSLNQLSRKFGTVDFSVPGLFQAVFLFINPPDEHLWFLYVMFLCLTAAYLLSYIKDRYLVGILFLLYLSTYYIDFPDIIWKLMRYMLIFYVGKAMNRHWQRMKKIPMALIIVISVVTSAAYIISRDNSFVGTGFIKPFAEISSTYFIMRLSSFLSGSKIKEILIFIGKESFPIYLFHQPYIVPVVITLIGGTAARNVAAVISAVAAGSLIPIMIDKLLLSKSGILSLLFLGGH